MRRDGTSSFNFALDPATNLMTLSVLSGDSGSIRLTSTYSNPPSANEAVFINYVFESGIVTSSSNSLGLALPAIGASANFALTSVGPFQATTTAISPGDAPVVLVFDSVGQLASLATPEPSSFTPGLCTTGTG